MATDPSMRIKNGALILSPVRLRAVTRRARRDSAGREEEAARIDLRLICPVEGGSSHVVIATLEPLCGKETVEVLGWQKHVLAVCG